MNTDEHQIKIGVYACRSSVTSLFAVAVALTRSEVPPTWTQGATVDQQEHLRKLSFIWRNAVRLQKFT